MRILFLFALLMNSAFAVFPQIDMQNISGDYLNGNGKAYAEKAYYVIPNAKISHEEIEIDFSTKEKSILIKDPNTSVELGYDFSFLNVLNAFSFDNLNIKSDDKLFTIISDVFDIYIDPTKYQIEQFFVETDIRNLPTSDDEDITILDGIILNAKLEAKKMSFKDFDIVIFEELLAENPELATEVAALEKKKNQALPMIIRHMKFHIKEGQMKGSALVDSYINLWFNVAGVVKANKENTIIEIKIDRAKLGIFSIRTVVLNAIKRMKLDKVSVDISKRTITIQIDDKSTKKKSGK